MISAEEALYQSCYCEENVYKLIEKIGERDNFYAVFISNDCQTIPLWSQKAARQPLNYVIWDYHVIAIEKNETTNSKVYDLDSTLEWGVDFSKYWEETMNLEEMNGYQMQYRRKFRLIPGKIYLSLFSSDRSHMKGTDGNYIKPPPTWPVINSEKPSNLMNLIKMLENIDDTIVMDEQQMFNFFSSSL